MLKAVNKTTIPQIVADEHAGAKLTAVHPTAEEQGVVELQGHYSTWKSSLKVLYCSLMCSAVQYLSVARASSRLIIEGIAKPDCSVRFF